MHHVYLTIITDNCEIYVVHSSYIIMNNAFRCQFLHRIDIAQPKVQLHGGVRWKRTNASCQNKDLRAPRAVFTYF